jgi:hypothetical protein
MVLQVKKTFGDTVGKNKREHPDNDLLDMTFDISDIPEKVYEDLISMDSVFLQTKFFPIEDKNGKQTISRDYLVAIDGKTGHLTENLEGVEGNITPEVQTLITQHGRDNLIYVIDEQRQVIAAYTDEDLKTKEVQIKKRNLHLEGEDLQKFLNAILLLQLGAEDGNTKNEGAVQNAIDEIDKDQKEEKAEQNPEDRERESDEFRKWFRDMKGYQFDK